MPVLQVMGGGMSFALCPQVILQIVPDTSHKQLQYKQLQLQHNDHDKKTLPVTYLSNTSPGLWQSEVVGVLTDDDVAVDSQSSESSPKWTVDHCRSSASSTCCRINSGLS